MSYHKRTKGSKKYNANRTAARLRQISEGPQPDYPPVQNYSGILRRRITVEDFDFGPMKEVVELWGTERIDCYEMRVDGKVIKKRIGQSRVLAEIRKAFPRVQSARSLSE